MREKLWFTPGFMLMDDELKLVFVVKEKDRDHPSAQLLEKFRKLKLMFRSPLPQGQDGWTYALTSKGKDFFLTYMRVYIIYRLVKMAEEEPNGLQPLLNMLDLIYMETSDSEPEDAVVWN